jgi:hypothetical protein
MEERYLAVLDCYLFVSTRCFVAVRIMHCLAVKFCTVLRRMLAPRR